MNLAVRTTRNKASFVRTSLEIRNRELLYQTKNELQAIARVRNSFVVNTPFLRNCDAMAR
jgi:hypothetical protein